jgi:hypothetical protein
MRLWEYQYSLLIILCLRMRLRNISVLYKILLTLSMSLYEFYQGRVK